MRVLVACEESQRVCQAFRDKGHEAYSCDILEPSGGHPEWHILGDAVPLVNGNCTFRTMDGATHTIDGKWDLLIAHPPCTYLTVTGNRWFDVQQYGESAKQRYKDRYKAIVFFMHFALANCDRIVIENPVCIMGSAWRSADQIIQPWMFGHPTVKKTCLWLKGLPPLEPTDIVEVDKSDVYEYVSKTGHIKHDSRNRSKCKASDRAKHRSKTFPGIAKAMAEQWGTIAADRKTENSSEKPNNCDDCIWSVCNYNKAFEDEPQTEKCDRPQMDCENCWKELHCRVKDEPQTEVTTDCRQTERSRE